jgi:large subunit ribosomal protein L25
MELAVTKRDSAKNTNTLRAEGVLPAVIYGRSQESTPIAIDRKTFEKVFKAAGESTVLTLTGLDGAKQALIQDVDVHPVTGIPMHADFYAIEKGQTVTVSVPIEFEGTAPAVKDLGGILTKVMHELEIEVDATELPQAFHVDVSALKTLDDQIKVSDLKLPKSAKLSIDPDEVVAMISVAQDEPAEPVVADISQIEISEDRGKKEEEAATDESKE